MHDDLIARLEAATGPDRELDAAVAAVAKAGLPAGCDWAFKFPNWEADHSRGGRVNVIGNVNGNGDYIAAHFTAPAYTASIEAALTLVPEGWGWDLYTDPSWKQAQVMLHGPSVPSQMGLASTPALAIVIAALKASGQGEG